MMDRRWQEGLGRVLSVVLAVSCMVACSGGTDGAGVAAPTSEERSSTTTTEAPATTEAPTTTTEPTAPVPPYSREPILITSEDGWQYYFRLSVFELPGLDVRKDVTASPPGKAKLAYSLTLPPGLLPTWPLGFIGEADPDRVAPELTGTASLIYPMDDVPGADQLYSGVPCGVDEVDVAPIVERDDPVVFNPGVAYTCSLDSSFGDRSGASADVDEAVVDAVIGKLAPTNSPVIKVSFSRIGWFGGRCALWFLPDGTVLTHGTTQVCAVELPSGGQAGDPAETDLTGLWYSTDLGEGGLLSFVLNADGTLSVFVLGDPNRTFSPEPGQRGIDETIGALQANGASGRWSYDEAGSVLTVEAGALPPFEFEMRDGLLVGGGLDYTKADPEAWPPAGA